MHRIVISVLAALAAVVGVASSGMRAEAANGGGFFVFSAGSKISCGSPKTCLAVGSKDNSSGTVMPAAEAWNGTAWKSVAVKTPKGATQTFLTGLSCRSATSCLAVGGYYSNAGDGGERPYAMTWNGTSLTPTAALPEPTGDDFVSVAAVSCVTARSCVAAGTGLSDGATRLVVETWNGTKWALRTARNLGGAEFAVLAGLSCSSVTSCVIAGTSVSMTGTEKLLLVRWNGKAFKPMKAAVPAGAGSVLELTDVSCPAVRRCVAVGFSQNSAGTRGFGFSEVWNGTSWTAVRLPRPKGDPESSVFGVSCVTPKSCIAVGEAGKSKADEARALSYNGKTWAQLSVPGPGKGKSSVLEGVSCPKAKDCVAIGDIGATNGKTVKPLAGRWNGKSWKLTLA